MDHESGFHQLMALAPLASMLNAGFTAMLRHMNVHLAALWLNANWPFTTPDERLTMAQYLRGQLGSATAAGETIAATILRYFGFELLAAYVRTLRWSNFETTREGGMTGGVGEIPVFQDEVFKTPNIVTPHSLPPTFVNVINEFGWVTNFNVALTATVSAVEQVSNGRFGCIGQSRSIYESDGVRLLSRDKIGLGMEFLALAGQKSEDEANLEGLQVHQVEVRPTGSEASVTLLSRGYGVRLTKQYWAVNGESLSVSVGNVCKGAFRRIGHCGWQIRQGPLS